MPQDDVRPLYRVILALGAAGAVILVLGLIEFVHFEPPGQQTGTSARVDGVFRYDARTKQVSGGDSTHFQRDEPFAARVDWSSLPGDLRVGAGWFDNFGQEVGRAGPAPAAELVDH